MVLTNAALQEKVSLGSLLRGWRGQRGKVCRAQQAGLRSGLDQVGGQVLRGLGSWWASLSPFLASKAVQTALGCERERGQRNCLTQAT
jgi:hypothetical protein